MHNLAALGLYELVWNHPPLPDGALLARVASPHARRTYRYAIDKFYWRIEREPCLAKQPGIEDYKAVLQLRLAPAVVALHLRIVRELYDEALAVGLVAANPMAKVASPQLSPDPGVEVPTRDDAARRLAACRTTSEAGRRERALCQLVMEVEIEPEQVNTLQVSDYRQDERGAALYLPRGEGRHHVRLPLSPEAAAALDAYLASRAVADDSPLFSGFPALGPGGA